MSHYSDQASVPKPERHLYFDCARCGWWGPRAEYTSDTCFEWCAACTEKFGAEYPSCVSEPASQPDQATLSADGSSTHSGLA